MDMTALTDLLRFSHVLMVAVGLGAAFLADFHSIRRLSKPVDDNLLTTLHSCHVLVWGALIAMWVTGIGLIYVRTGFQLANFTPKLFSKLVTVSVLTANAMWIGRYAIPIIEAQIGRNIMWLPLKQKLILAGVAALSTTSWLLALSMGISKVLAQSGWLTFLLTLPIAYLLCTFVALAVMFLLHVGGSLGTQRPLAANEIVGIQSEGRVQIRNAFANKARGRSLDDDLDFATLPRQVFRTADAGGHGGRDSVGTFFKPYNE
jgi:hypothetical protein